jgi:photosystem II stability/assembly factor-like uncharacterized protein
VYFTNENTGYICGYNTVLKTTNSGTNWVNSFLQGGHKDIKFVNENTGFICSDSGKIFKTTNAGVSWNSMNSGTVNHLMRMDFFDENTIVIAGYKRTIIKTTNSGMNWVSLIPNHDTLDFYGCKIISENNYIVTGTGSAIYSSMNAGANWIASGMGVVNPLWATEFIDENTGWLTGCCGMFIKTTNAGLSWTPEAYLTLGYTLFTMKFINNTTGYISGENGIMYRTTNQGNSWDSTVTPTNEILYSVNMANSSTGWAVGNFGTILKTTNGGGQGYTIGINQLSNEIPKNFKLYNNYPNPFNPETKIKFDIGIGVSGGVSNVIVNIFDINGRLVETLVNRELRPGSYEVNWNASGKSSGVYFYRLIAGDMRETRKMVLIR